MSQREQSGVGFTNVPAQSSAGAVDQILIARRLGIAQSTVSRALAGDARISNATRERVLRTASALGYTPNFVARSLVTQRTRTIGVLLATTEYHFYALSAIAAQQRLMLDGYSTTLCVTDQRLDREREYVRFLAERQVDGLVVISYSTQAAVGHLLRLRARCPSIVLVNRYHDDLSLDTVLLGDFEGGRLATGHLAARGHRHIAFLGLDPASAATIRTTHGYHEALYAYKLPDALENLAFSAKDVTVARLATERLLERNPRLTAIVAVSDTHAAGALQAAQAYGRRVPEDLAITGYDDTPGAVYTTPSLTSVRMPWQEAGTRAAELVLERLAEPDRPAVRVDLAPSLSIRASSGG